MATKGNKPDSYLIDRFWHNYLSILDNNSVPLRSRVWYRKHIEKYIEAHSGERLAVHTPENIDSYLNVKGRNATLHEWQFRQIAEALRLLFCELVRPDWAGEYDWYAWRAKARDLESDHPSLLRDANALTLVGRSQNPDITQFRHEYAELHTDFVKTLRVRQMAIRTEKTYEHWFV